MSTPTDTPRTHEALMLASDADGALEVCALCAQLERENAAFLKKARENATLAGDLLSENRKLRADKGRLDWLDSQCRGVQFFTMDGPFDGSLPRQFFQVDGLGIEKARHDLRDAIDAAKESTP